MRTTYLLWPMLAQVVWTIAVLLGTGRARIAALQAREARMADIALDATRWPDRPRQWANNLTNQFETPVLFYVATRIAHTLVHVGSNDVRQRFIIFVVGVAALLAMAIGVAIALVG